MLYSASAFYCPNDLRTLSHLAMFIPKSVRPWACFSFGFFIKHYFFFFFKLLIPYLGFLDKCHSSAFMALILSFPVCYGYLQVFFHRKCKNWRCEAKPDCFLSTWGIYSPTVLKNILFLFIQDCEF